LDGRKWDETRERKVEYDQRHRIAHASIGRTRIMCSIDCEVGAPRKSNKPNAGTINFSMDVLPMAHPSPSDLRREVDECLQLLDTLYRETYCIDFDTLCIEANRYVLELKCHIRVLDYDGALWDCCTLAVTTALVGFRRNDITFCRSTQQLLFYSEFERAQVPLTMYYRPTTITFGFVGAENHQIGLASEGVCQQQGASGEVTAVVKEEQQPLEPLVDPTPEESVLIVGYLVIGSNHRDEVCLLHQIGQLENVDEATLSRCTELVLARVKPVVKQITDLFIGANTKSKPSQRGIIDTAKDEQRVDVDTQMD